MNFLKFQDVIVNCKTHGCRRAAYEGEAADIGRPPGKVQEN